MMINVRYFAPIKLSNGTKLIFSQNIFAKSLNEKPVGYVMEVNTRQITIPEGSYYKMDKVTLNEIDAVPETPATRLKSILEKAGLQNKEFLSRIFPDTESRGQNRTASLSRQLNGKEDLPEIILFRAQKYLNINPDYVLKGKGPVYRALPPMAVHLPYLSSALIAEGSAAKLSDPDNWPLRYHSDVKAEDVEDCILMDVPDSAMAPQINAGAVIRARKVEPEDYPSLERIVVVCAGGKVLIRRVDEISSFSIRLKPDNHNFPTKSLSLEEVDWIYQVEYSMTPVY